jgi:spectinomycin phosphotransferase
MSSAITDRRTCKRMLEKPDLQDEAITACLQDEFGLDVVQVSFLPIGADQNTAVYRAVAADETAYFVKLRRGTLNETPVALPKFLSDQSIGQIIAPLTTTTGELWASLDGFKVIAYPFIEGRNGFEVALTDRQWIEFGTALKQIHAVQVPVELAEHIRRELFSPRWRETVKTFLSRVDDGFDDPVAAKAAALLRDKQDVVLDMVARAERHAQLLQTRPLEPVLCHYDIHAGNLLIDSATDAIYIVDWDDPIMAPKERDLMFIGGGIGGVWNTPREETLFYRGYGPTEIDAVALAYYRYERIIEDIAVHCEQLLLTSEGGRDREQSYRYLQSNFLPNETVEMAYKAGRTVRGADTTD